MPGMPRMQGRQGRERPACCDERTGENLAYPINSALFCRRELRQQGLLRAEPFPPAAGFEMIITLAVHFPCLSVILDVHVQTFGQHALFQSRFQNGKTYFNAAKEISIHPVSAGKIDGVGAPASKIKNPCMFQETPYYRSHPYILGQSLDAGA